MGGGHTSGLNPLPSIDLSSCLELSLSEPNLASLPGTPSGFLSPGMAAPGVPCAHAGDLRVYSSAPHVQSIAGFFSLLGLPPLCPFLSVFTEHLSPSHSPLLPGLTTIALVRLPVPSWPPLVACSPSSGRMI